MTQTNTRAIAALNYTSNTLICYLGSESTVRALSLFFHGNQDIRS